MKTDYPSVLSQIIGSSINGYNGLCNIGRNPYKIGGVAGEMGDRDG